MICKYNDILSSDAMESKLIILFDDWDNSLTEVIFQKVFLNKTQNYNFKMYFVKKL